ncbi:DUF1302 domain-containing protein [Paraburkholderia rhynchosiae]|uniref:DUF1302 domain-containing protein n=1 Tax=Paraburkholderia rhynchosiae TaxID=487049 RepID=A0A2N7W532_9BURK|nr:DUF1302 family protein [Paraburkholderia rhynchosiae]PMS24495.1 DUF1302 domain-containing protein [Paraburkholderia rhynchosiae]CAB3736042.1 hypothetical protein LMG27174_06263 [Paraburkholderia rhynchosiae]
MMRNVARSSSRLLGALIAVLAVSGAVWPEIGYAYKFDTGIPDLSVQWDNTVRYSLGVRAEDCDADICGNGKGAGDVTAHQSDRKFAKAGDLVTNRLDLLSQLDVIYKGHTGFRLSGTGWYDAAYTGGPKGDPFFLSQGLNSFRNNQYTNYIDRWNRGPSGELLDAFAFTRVDLGSVPVDIRAGQYNIFWGESIFCFVCGVAYNQGPVDIRKALTNPSAQAQELFLPRPQLSFSAALTPEVTLAGQYFLDWSASRLPDGGTYFGPADFVSLGGGTIVPVLGTPAVFQGQQKPAHMTGDFGVAVKWRPEWLGGTAGFYYRQYTTTFPQLVIGSASGGNLNVDLNYRAPRERMYAFSLSKQIAGISFGTDLTYRTNAELGAPAFSNVVAANAAGADWIPRGNVFSGVVNMIDYIGKTPLFDSATLIAEVNYAGLQRVTHDPFNLYFGRSQNCGSDGVATHHGCPTRNAVGIAAQFEPIWYELWPGVNLSMPLFISVGLSGNSPVLFGSNQGQGSYSVGLSFDVKSKYKVSLKYIGYLALHSNDNLGVASNSNSSLGKYWDRNWVSLTLETTF